MKTKLLSLSALILICFSLLAQAPEKFNYQAVARNNSGQALANQSIGVKINIRSGSAGGTIVYSETHAVSTNQLGLFTLAIGGGTPVSGTLGAIDWGANSYFAETEIDPAGGSSYTSLGTAQLLSVPYALYAKDGGPWTRSGNNITNSNSGNVGIGVSVPTAKLQVELNGAGTLARLKRTGTQSSSEMMQIETDTITASSDLISLSIPSTSPANAQFIEFERGGVPVAQINTNGDFDTDGEYQRSATGDANLAPVAYGYILPNGTIQTANSTSNFTVSKTATGVYQITINGIANYSELVVSVTAKNTGVSTPDFVNYGSITGKLIVYTFTYSGGAFSAQDDDFSFIVYHK